MKEFQVKDIFSKCQIYSENKKGLHNIYHILKNDENRKNEKKIKEVFKYIDNILKQDFEKDILSIPIALLKENDKKIIFNNLRRLFKCFFIFVGQQEYIDSLSDFLFYLYKYMRKADVKKTYKVLRKYVSFETKEEKEKNNTNNNNNNNNDNNNNYNNHSDNNDNNHSDDNNFITSGNKLDNIKNKYTNIKENNFFRNKFLFHFIFHSNILIYLEKLKKEDSKNLTSDEHYFFMNLKNNILNKKYILTLSNYIPYIVLSYPSFPLFLENLFNIFFFVRNNLMTFFIKNIYKKVVGFIYLKNTDINKRFTLKKYYNLLIYVYFLYKIKIVISIYLNHNQYIMLNDILYDNNIIELYIDILKDFKNTIYFIFNTIKDKNNVNNAKGNHSLQFCLIILYLINIVYSNHNDVLNIFLSNSKFNKKIFFLDKYKNIFSQYNNMYNILFKHTKSKTYDDIKMYAQLKNNMYSKSLHLKKTNNKHKNYKNGIIIKDKGNNHNNIHNNNDNNDDDVNSFFFMKKEKNYNYLKYIRNDLLQKQIQEKEEGGEYSLVYVLLFFYHLTTRFIKIYDYTCDLNNMVFFKKFLLYKIIKEKKHLNNKHINDKKKLSVQNKHTDINAFTNNVITENYSKCFYNTHFFNLVKNNFFLYINIDKNILNVLFNNELQMFLNNKNLNYKNLYHMLIYNWKNKYNQFNIRLLLYKVIFKNIMKYILCVRYDNKDNYYNNDYYYKYEKNKNLKETQINNTYDNTDKNDNVDKNYFHMHNIIYLFNKKNTNKFKSLHIKEYQMNKNQINDMIMRHDKNTFIILKHLDFLDLHKDKSNFLFDKNIINLIMYQLTSETINILKHLYTCNLKTNKQTNNKDHVNPSIYYLTKNINLLIIILKTMLNLINSFIQIINMNNAGKKKCTLIYHKQKKECILFSEEYHKEIKNENTTTKQMMKEEIYLDYVDGFNKNCMKKKNFHIIKKIFKLYINIIKTEYKNKSNTTNDNDKKFYIYMNEFIELGKIIIFVFNFIIFYIINNIKDTNIHIKMDAHVVKNLKKKRYKKIFCDIHNLYNLLKDQKHFTCSNELKKKLFKFYKHYHAVNQRVNSKMNDKNYFACFMQYNYLEKNKIKYLKISKKIFIHFKSLTPAIIWSTNIEENESNDENHIIQKNNNFMIPIQDNEEDNIILSATSLLDILADDTNNNITENNNHKENDNMNEDEKKKKKKSDLKKKKNHTDLFYNVTSLLKCLKINLKKQSAQSVIKSIYYLLYSLVVLSKKVKMILKQKNIVEGCETNLSDVEESDQKNQNVQVHKKDNILDDNEKSVHKKDKILDDNEKSVHKKDNILDDNILDDNEKRVHKKDNILDDNILDDNISDNNILDDEESSDASLNSDDYSEEEEKKKRKSISSIYIEDMKNLEKRIVHILFTFKVLKDIEMKDIDKLNISIEKYLYKIITIIIKEKKNLEILRMCLKCLECYHNIESKIIQDKKKNFVINYLFELIQIIYHIPKLKEYYSKYLNIFFKSSFVRYININEIFNGSYNFYFESILNRFISDLDLNDYINNNNNNKKKINNMNLEQKEYITNKFIDIIKETNKKIYVMKDENYLNYLNIIKNKDANNISTLTTFSLNELSHVIQNIYIHFNQILTDNYAYAFNKKVNLNLLLLLKKIANMFFIKQNNIQMYKNQFIKYLSEFLNFQTRLDEQLSTQKISININEFLKKLSLLIQTIKSMKISDDQKFKVNDIRQISNTSTTISLSEHIKSAKKKKRKNTKSGIHIKKKIKVAK
ncbi:conserved Plasmodium protein, unknown function [Plasmodium sp. gorilla clade G2]|uniref:conserved Plasmodium protein, unknown function n=1 Tax=Plasmodium sp. gorilla clade G2 TaxID=880535 RepID=UPI000D22540B|nr:conserved Plasmodium protein, unknown function [Plasmodium sp. gorilla clade G2]SOV17018.1 conserved Plasmodium protein, unknown function [Plasmodium sp. gorilla clade G2]